MKKPECVEYRVQKKELLESAKEKESNASTQSDQRGKRSTGGGAEDVSTDAGAY